MSVKPYYSRETDKESLPDRKERVAQPPRLSHGEAEFCISSVEGTPIWKGDVEATSIGRFRTSNHH